MKIEAIDLFCGAGGLTRGLLDSGVKVKAGFDMEESCKYAYELNNKGARFFKKDVGKLTGIELNQLWSPNSIRLLAGCAPCQPFSSAANSFRAGAAPSPLDTEHSQEEKIGADPRYNLLDEFTRLIKECLPHLVTMENVPKVREHPPFQKFVRTLSNLGYDVWYENVRCTDLGIPQTRRRLVLLASRLGKLPSSLEQPTSTTASSTVGEALAMLIPLAAGEADPNDRMHFARKLSPINLKRIRASKPGGTWRDWPNELRAPCHMRESGATFSSVYARMSADKAAPTMTTQFFNFGAGRFGHPIQDRALTPREAAILQSFPPKYEFVPSGGEVYMQQLGKMIGNAVPPKLGEAIGRTFIRHIHESRKNK